MMKKTLLFAIAAFFCSSTFNLTAQTCTPLTSPCTNGAAVSTFGGLCDTTIIDGLVNTSYFDAIQFYIEGVCFDAGIVSPTYSGQIVRVSSLNSFTFSDMPVGVSGGTNQPSYTIAQNATVFGCGYYNGTPTEAGVFETEVLINATVTLCSFNFPINQDLPFQIKMNVLPDASFSGLSSVYCSTDGAVTLTPTGTTGGTFSGPGVSGNSFDPSAAGVGTHTITYEVTAQEGTAIGSTTNSSTQQVTVGLSTTYYADSDGDSFGDASVSITSCVPVSGYVTNADDCDDSDAGANPNATDIPNNGIDEDCNGSDETTVMDADGDGFDNTTDCDDNDPLINPSATEICDGIDNNCDGQIDEGLLNTYYEDLDGDGFGTNNDSVMVCATTAPAGYADNADDCDDADNVTYPGAQEICDGLDNNCDGDIDEGLTLTTFYVDADNDGFGVDDGNAISDCSTNAPAGYSVYNTDCDDTDNTIYPGATEIPNDGIDQDCDSATVAIRDVKENLNVSIYPNPTQNILNVNLGTKDAMNIQLFDMNGKQVFQNNVNQDNLVIDMATFNNGVYLIKITNENGAYAVQKVVKAN